MVRLRSFSARDAHPSRRAADATCALLLAGATLLLARPAAAQPGALDPTFGGDGRVTTDVAAGSPESAQAVAIQPDGKIVAAGSAGSGSRANFALVRYNPDGSLDSAFGAGGRVTTDFLGNAEGIADIALQADGKIVAVGGALTGGQYTIALARYNPNGSLDQSFGTGGRVTAGSTFGRALALQPDGKIVVAGSLPAVLLRVNPDGTVDTTFGSGGFSELDFTAYDIDLDSSGRILVVGDDVVIIGPDPEDPEGSIGRQDAAVARFTSEGLLDTTFGGGKVLTTVGTLASSFRAVTLQPDGRILAAGSAGNQGGNGNGFAVARYNSDGSLDTGFGQSGTVTSQLGEAGASAEAVAVQADGKIVAAGGTVGYTTSNDFVVARYLADGTPDADFGNGGATTTDFLNRTSDIAWAMALQADGRIVLAGHTNLGDTPTNTFALARYQIAFTPDAALAGLLNEVTGLVQSGVLSAAEGQELSVKLQHARSRLLDGKPQPARASLQAFVNEVNALIASGDLSSSQGDSLVSQAEAILAHVS